MTYPMVGNYGVPNNNDKDPLQPLLPGGPSSPIVFKRRGHLQVIPIILALGGDAVSRKMAP